MSFPTNVCTRCARPLRSKAVIRSGKPTTIMVCKTLTCQNYNKASKK